MYHPGDKFQLSEEALDNYGQDYAGKVFTVRARYDHYVSPDKMAADETGHPGFDPGGGRYLYGSELPFDLYEWEMVQA